jgi:hypothetical protein
MMTDLYVYRSANSILMRYAANVFGVSLTSTVCFVILEAE